MLTEKDNIKQPPCATRIMSAWSSQLQLFHRKSTEANHSCRNSPHFSRDAPKPRLDSPVMSDSLSFYCCFHQRWQIPLTNWEHLPPRKGQERIPLREGWTDATLYESHVHELSPLILSCFFSSVVGKPGSLTSCSETHPPVPAPSGTEVHLLHHL